DWLIPRAAPGRMQSLARARPRVCFFSGRRRHTSFSRDWSSDVCSSDLVVVIAVQPPFERGLIDRYLVLAEHLELEALIWLNKLEIGRASCRERGKNSVAAGCSRGQPGPARRGGACRPRASADTFRRPGP